MEASNQLAPFLFYQDNLRTGWVDWSWDTTRNLSNTSPVYAGARSVSVTYTKAWGGLFFHNDNGISTTGYTHLTFYVHGGTQGNQRLRVFLNYDDTRVYNVTTQANRWTRVQVPLSVLGSPTNIKDICLQNVINGSQPTFYMDRMMLVEVVAAPTTTPTARASATQAYQPSATMTTVFLPTITNAPTQRPTNPPTATATLRATSTPTQRPTQTATTRVTATITRQATQQPSPTSTRQATSTPTPRPTSTLIVAPSATSTTVFLPTVTNTAIATEPPKSDTVIFADSLSSGWQSWSWDTTVNQAVSSPVQAGSRSLSATFTGAWGGLYLHSDPAVSATGYAELSFWIHGGSAGNQHLLVSVNRDEATRYEVTATANTWTQVRIPLTRFGSPDSITDIIWQDSTGGSQPVFYLDQIILTGTAAPTPTPAPGSGPSLSIDASTNQHAISPYVYGMNWAPESLAAELRLPVNRMGGNSTTRYNWQNDTSNRASDWFFENIPEQNSNPGALPNGSLADRIVEGDRRAGSQSLLTIPMIGWTPKSRAEACGFAVSKYGAQQWTDSYRPDCGNGVNASGANITGNDPRDTSVEIGPAFVQDWLRHLIGLYGTAANGGVRFYNLDNEPMLWYHTHRDVHPNPVSYDEIRDRTYQYASALKAVDPSAQTLGPVLWGWSAYFYSALDSSQPGSWWNNPIDRNAHGGLPFVEWYLQQMRAYEQNNGVRILDYLDLHYYPQASNVTLSDAVDSSTQALRLRSTRSLWDANYTDESWINEPVRLIPRMRDWVNAHYPGTKLAITEYNWGAYGHINGAIAQADVLGIFGREGLDLATLWAAPESSQPVTYAFRIYRNYDGQGSAFGETSIQSSSTDQDKLAVYAATRASDGAMTLVIINKTSSTQSSPVSVANFAAASSAQVYRYSTANLNAIVRQADQAISGNSFTMNFPANSITLIVIPRR